MKPASDCLFEFASSQLGYFTSAQARGCGYSPALLSHHVGSHRFQRVRRGLYRLRDYPSSRREEVMAAWLAAGPRAVVSHESALDLLELADVIPSRIHITVPRGRRGWTIPSGVVAHTVRDDLESDEAIERGGMRVTSPARTLVDVAEAGLSPDQLGLAVRQAIERGMATPDQLLEKARARSASVARAIARATAIPA